MYYIFFEIETLSWLLVNARMYLHFDLGYMDQA